MVKRIEIMITGRVQGVFFRASVAEEARKLEIVGFVRNEPDGSLYLEAEGEEMALKELLQWCRRGPQGAIVEKVTHEWKEPSRTLHDFVIQ